MWANNRPCLCHITTGCCLCTNPMTIWSNSTELLNSNKQTYPVYLDEKQGLNSNNLLYYQSASEDNSMYGFSHASNLVNTLFQEANDQEACELMGANEVDSWLMSNPDKDQIGGSLNLGSYGACGGDQCQGQFMQMQTQDFQETSEGSRGFTDQTSSLSMEATIGTMDLPQESVGTYSNSTNYISLRGTQQLASLDDLQKPSEYPLMSRRDRLQRYFEKKKRRKYKKKLTCSSRKTNAQARPRIRGRFASASQMDANQKQLLDQSGQ